MQATNDLWENACHQRWRRFDFTDRQGQYVRISQGCRPDWFHAAEISAKGHRRPAQTNDGLAAVVMNSVKLYHAPTDDVQVLALQRNILAGTVGNERSLLIELL